MTLTSTLEETQGPFFSTVETTVERSVLYDQYVTGIPLNYTLTLVDETGVAQSGVKVCIWHASPAGTYSDEKVQTLQTVDTTAYTWLRGYQVTNSAGQASFTDYFPSPYNGRAAHLHCRVITFASDGTSIATNETTQMFFPPAITAAVIQTTNYKNTAGNTTTNAEDSIYDSTLLMSLVANSSTDITQGYSGTFQIVMPIGGTSTTTTTATTATATSTSTIATWWDNLKNWAESRWEIILGVAGVIVLLILLSIYLRSKKNR